MFVYVFFKLKRKKHLPEREKRQESMGGGQISKNIVREVTKNQWKILSPRKCVSLPSFRHTRLSGEAQESANGRCLRVTLITIYYKYVEILLSDKSYAVRIGFKFLTRKKILVFRILFFDFLLAGSSCSSTSEICEISRNFT